MGIQLTNILAYANLKEARVRYGITGLSRMVENISVYELDFVVDFKQANTETLYITSLQHFREQPEKLLPWLKQLNESATSGLLVVEDSIDLFTEKEILYCNNEGFPIISVYRDMPYAEIIRSVSSLLYFNNLYVNRENALLKIYYEDITEKAKLDILQTLCPNLSPLLKVIAIQGSFNSSIYSKEFEQLLTAKRNSTCAPFNDDFIILLSGKDSAALESSAKAARQLIDQYFQGYSVGESKDFPVGSANHAIRNAFSALSLAKVNHSNWEVFDAFSVTTLLLELKNTEALRSFYDTVLNIINICESKGETSYLDCVREYVSCHGEYKVMATRLFQSENAIRYKINKLKQAMCLEKDSVRFDTILTLFTTIENIEKL